MEEAELIKAAERFGISGVRAAGVFGLQDNYLAVFAAGAHVSSGEDGEPAVAANHEILAETHGMTVSMLVAVTDESIEILDYPSTRRLMSFERAKTKVQVTKEGLGRNLDLSDGSHSIGLTGTVALFSTHAEGDSVVIHLLKD